MKQKRKDQKLSQATLAELMDSSQSRVAKIEKNDPSVSLELTIRALFITGVSRQELAAVISQ
ncbi:MAG TPA: helix-turn-helix domain-containing protein [Coleofasciculaceae cyanobacterium]